MLLFIKKKTGRTRILSMICGIMKDILFSFEPKCNYFWHQTFRLCWHLSCYVGLDSLLVMACLRWMIYSVANKDDSGLYISMLIFFFPLYVLETCTCSLGQSCSSFSNGSFLCVAWGNCLSKSFAPVPLTHGWWNKVDLLLFSVTGLPIIFWIWTISRVPYKGEGKDRHWDQGMAWQERKETFLTSTSGLRMLLLWINPL